MQRAAAAPGCSSAFSARHRPRPALTQAPAPFRIATHRPTTCCSPRDRPADRHEDLTVAIGTYVYDGLVLCDVMLGDDDEPDGYFVHQHIRQQRPDLAATPFIFLTALGQRDDLLPPAAGAAPSSPLVALGAARLGSTRLIDNLEF